MALDNEAMKAVFKVAFHVVSLGWLVLIICAAGNAAWQGWRLSRVMKRKYPAKLVELSTLWGMPGMRNPFRAIPWFVGPDCCGDDEVRRLKRAANWSVVIFFAIFSIFPFVVAATVVFFAVIGAILEGR